MEEKNDLKNAFNVLKKAREFIKEELNKVPDEYRKLIGCKLLYLESSDYPSFRGGSKYYLCLRSTELDVKIEFNDGWTSSKDICFTRRFSYYDYNSNESVTIWLAAKIAENWADIKDKVKKTIAEYLSNKEKTSNLLQNFEI